jgi:hypothetical protein
MGKAGCLDPSRVSLTMPPTRFNHRAVRLIPRVIYEMVINFLGKRSPSPGLERGGGAFYVIHGVWFPSHLMLEGSNYFCVCEP